jgi:hypothetical protein
LSGSGVHALRKYLKDWAEPEVRLAGAVEGTYERVLIVPACREEASLLDQYVVAARTSRGRTLCILVVNGPDDASEEEHAENALFLESVLAKLDGTQDIGGVRRAFLGTMEPGNLEVLVVDRASSGAGVPRKEGVGLARKIGCDIAVALHAAGRVRSDLLFGTDADATLPEAFFDHPELEERSDLAGAVFPFWHVATEDADITNATAFYELSLRYYVEGLAWAGSPYAFHTLGSATAVAATAYASVRGMPKRAAAEDFYLLNKIAKVGVVARVPGAAIELRSRASDRTPFGTGASVKDAVASGDRTLYAPECFAVLRAFLGKLEAFAEHADVARFFVDLEALAGEPRAAVIALLRRIGAEAALAAASREAKTAEARRLRVHTWFDAFRTLKLVHAVRDRGSPNVRWSEALVAAPFVEHFSDEQAEQTDPALVALRAQLARVEATRSPWMGPWGEPRSLLK